MKTPKDVLALGRAIVQELDLPRRGATLERWLAHHLAEVLEQVDHAGDGDRPALERQAVELILTLWEKRWSLPVGFHPVSGYRRVIEVLDRLAPESNPWLHSGHRDELLDDMFQILSRCVVSGLLLTLEPGLRDLTPGEIKALGNREAALLSTLESWRRSHVRASPRFGFVHGGTKAVGTGMDDDAGKSTDVDEDHATEVRDVSEKDRLHAAIVEDLERMRIRLSELSDRWRKTRPNGSAIK